MRIISLIIAIIFIFFTFYGIYSVTTDKEIYSSEENINISFSDITFFRCPTDADILIYQDTDDGWKEITRELISPEIPEGFVCLDGNLTPIQMSVDLKTCILFKEPIKSGKIEWNKIFYEEKDTKEICSNMIPFNKPLMSYETKTASLGKYKATYRFSEKVFEII